jgi:hypothetical protein
LFWLQRHGWPALDVDGARVHGEPAWRAWAARASLDALGAVRAQLVEGRAARRPSTGVKFRQTTATDRNAEGDTQGAPAVRDNAPDEERPA